ncbi:MAG: hypothetical protein OXC79_05050 [Candidatus Poribacteria bacterium]|nr:hypothetical protein [Candidatus Poribacteria bacterium]
MPNTREIRPVGIATQERSEPNFIPAELGTLDPKALGFSRFLVNAGCMETTLFFYDFYGFGGIRSTQPTIR